MQRIRSDFGLSAGVDVSVKDNLLLSCWLAAEVLLTDELIICLR